MAEGWRSVDRSVTGKRGGESAARFCGDPFQLTAASAAGADAFCSSDAGWALGSGGGAGRFAQSWPRFSP